MMTWDRQLAGYLTIGSLSHFQNPITDLFPRSNEKAPSPKVHRIVKNKHKNFLT